MQVDTNYMFLALYFFAFMGLSFMAGIIVGAAKERKKQALINKITKE